MLKKSIIFLLCIIFLLSSVSCDTEREEPPLDTEGSTAAEDAVLLCEEGSAHYRIVLPQGASETLLQASTLLQNAIKEICGRKPERVYDDTDKNPAVEREILIGLTSRAASDTVAKTLGEDELVIRFVDGKLVLLGADDYLTAQAVEALLVTWSVEGKGILLPSSLSLRQDLSESLLPLLNGDNFAFSVAYEAGIPATAVDEAVRFAGEVQLLFGGSKPTVRKDTVARPEGEHEILVGYTNRAESDTAYREMSGVGYHLSVVDGHIALAVTSHDLIPAGLDMLLNVLKTAKSGTLRGTPKLPKSYTFQNGGAMQDKTWYTSVPALTEGRVTGGFSADPSSCVIERELTTEAGFHAYLQTLESQGFAEGEDYTLGANLYALRHGAYATVYLSFSKGAGTTRLYVEKKGLYCYPEKGSAEAGELEPVLWQLETDTKGAKENGGMSYVLRTATGSFIVIDGGYYTEAEADKLYQLLRENTPAGKQTVIEAWYISHLHWDHFGGMYAFSEKYSSTVDVKGFYYRFDYLGRANTTRQAFVESTSRGLWKDAVHYGGLQTGMEFCISGIRFNVYYTLIDLYPVTAGDSGFDFNDTSTVLSASVGDARVMFLGDIMDKASECLMKYMDTEALQSDIVQFSHHGYEGASRAVYQAIRAETVLWPLNVVGYQASGYSSVPQNVFDYWHKRQLLPNYYICYQASYVKKIIVSGMGDARMDLPYTPTGDKLPDFNAYYEANK